MEAVGVLVEVVEVVILDRRPLDLVGGLVASRNLHPVADASHFDLADRGSLAGMDVFGGQNHVKLAVLLDDVALANRTGDDFQSCFPEFLASDLSGQMCPAAVEAVLGCNILICPPDTSLLRPVPAGYGPAGDEPAPWLFPLRARG